MTCIIGYVEGGKVYMGSDSFVTNGDMQQPLETPKCFRRGPLLIGVAGPVRLLQLVKYHSVIDTIQFDPAPTNQDEIEAAVIHAFVEPLREQIKSKGFMSTDGGRDDMNASVLVAYAGHLLYLDRWFGLVEYKSGLHAIGNGYQLALGAFHAMTGPGIEDRLLEALRITGATCWGVGPPYHVEVLEND